MSVDSDLIDLFAAELELCKVRPDEVVAILSNPDRRDTHLGDYAKAATLAAQRLGANVFELSVPKNKGGTGRGRGAFGGSVGMTPVAGVPAAVEALKSADLIIDLMLLLHSPEQTAILGAGARMLLVQEPPEILKRNFPTKELRQRVEEAEQVLRSGRTMHVTSDAGTDITYEFGQYKRYLAEYGYTDEPGRWDHWPAGMVAGFANDDGVNGTVVAMPGDLIFPLKRYVSSPIEIKIEKGRITSIEGGLDALLVREFMAQWNDPNVYGMSHIGWGLNDRALWTAVATTDMSDAIGMEQHCYEGAVLFSTGPNIEGGGSRKTACHVDIPLLGCNLSIDGKPIVQAGKLVA